MTDLRTAAQQALEAMEGGADSWQLVGPAIDALRAALAEPVVNQQLTTEPVQEPVHEHEDWCASVTQLLLCDPPRKAPCNCKHTAPPQRRPLTEEEIDSIWDSEKAFADIYAIARAIERAHGIGVNDE